MKIHIGGEAYTRIKNQDAKSFREERLFITESQVKTKSREVNDTDGKDLQNAYEQRIQDEERMRRRIIKEKQSAKDDIEKMQQKHYLKTMKLITHEPSNSKYYDPYPVKPGVHFIKALVCSDIPIKQLKIPMPHTVGLFDERFYLYTNEKGYLVYKSHFKDQDFIDACDKPIRHAINRTSEAPFIVKKQQDFPPYNIEKTAIAYKDEKIEEMLTKMEGDVILQQFIHPFGGKATFLRFQYHNPKSVSGKLNTAVLVTNRGRIMENLSIKGLQERAFVNQNIINSFDAFTQKQQQGFIILEEIAQQLIEFMICSYRLKMSKIVLDFMKDDNDEKICFMGVKYFEVDERSALYKQILCQDDEVKKRELMDKKQDPHEAQLIYQCILCKEHYEKCEMKRVITHKMIIDLKNHLNKRGIFLLEQINPQILNDLNINHQKWKTNTCKVCDICYLIVVAEQDLQNVEKRFAEVQNIPVLKTDSKIEEQQMAEMNAIANKGKPKFNTSQFKEQLIQWRILITLNQFFDLEKEELDRINKNKEIFYLQIKLFDYITIFEVRTNNFKKIKSYDPEVLDSDQIVVITSLDLFKIRVHYFFTQTANINTFLTNIKIELRLTLGESWTKNVIAMGFINPFKYLNKFNYDRVQMQSFRAFLFSDQMQRFSLDGMVGLKQDQPIKTENVQLYQQHDIYVPDNGYYNCDPFPLEWLEIIDRKIMLGNYTEFEEVEQNTKKSLNQQIFENYFPLAKIDEEKISKIRNEPLKERPKSAIKSKIQQYNLNMLQVRQTPGQRTRNANNIFKTKQDYGYGDFLTQFESISTSRHQFSTIQNNNDNVKSERNNTSSAYLNKQYQSAKTPSMFNEQKNMPKFISNSSRQFTQQSTGRNNATPYNDEKEKIIHELSISEISSNVRDISQDLDDIVNDKLRSSYDQIGVNINARSSTANGRRIMNLRKSHNNQYFTLRKESVNSDEYSIADKFQPNSGKPIDLNMIKKHLKKPITLKKLMKRLEREDVNDMKVQKSSEAYVNKNLKIKKPKKLQSSKDIFIKNSYQQYSEYKQDFNKVIERITGGKIEKQKKKRSKTHKRKSRGMGQGHYGSVDPQIESENKSHSLIRTNDILNHSIEEEKPDDLQLIPSD
ncbi:UNKNOWN [Stylonychia lemnae]|uniref:Uncharacterized protein n=1 Tax=Stylonychia lemnae TaxID=5949 RepID=A0A078ACX2_STYLE|nr:UNKNOWN [Stylonychia lemnae]|eukprot:CDW79711.1 UNKNOWN [Stylonychia lemnae]